MIISISKGRIFNIVKEIFKNNKIIFLNENSRELILKTNIKNFNVIPIKSNDICFYIKKKKIDVGIIGSDIFYENKIVNCYKKIINIFNCRLSIITKNKYNLIRKYYIKNKITIFSKYLNITKKYFYNKNLNLIFLNGTFELTIKLKISKYISDIVDTGKTLSSNNLYEIDVVKKIRPLLIFNKKKIKKNKLLKKLFL